MTQQEMERQIALRFAEMENELCVEGRATERQMWRALARECVRQMRWAECCHRSPDGGPPPYLCVRPAPDEWIPPDYDTYDMRGDS